MLSSRTNMRTDEKGNTIIEFAIVATVFFMMLVGIAAAGHLFYTHNALVEATRRGARYAVLQCKPAQSGCPNSDTATTRIKNIVVYGTDAPAAGATPLISGLQTSNVTVEYSTGTGFGIAAGTVSVSIDDSLTLGVPVSVTVYPSTSVADATAGNGSGSYWPATGSSMVLMRYYVEWLPRLIQTCRGRRRGPSR